MSTEEASLPAFDAAALLALARGGDEAARAGAYRRVFNTEMGRFVLLDILRNAGVGGARGILDGDQRAFADGQNDLAINIAAAAGFDPHALALSHMTGTLEGTNHDGHGHTIEPASDGLEPDDEFS